MNQYWVVTSHPTQTVVLASNQPVIVTALDAKPEVIVTALQGPPGKNVRLMYDEFEWPNPVIPSKTPYGLVLSYFNGLLLSPADDPFSVWDNGDKIMLVYLTLDA